MSEKLTLALAYVLLLSNVDFWGAQGGGAPLDKTVAHFGDPVPTFLHQSCFSKRIGLASNVFNVFISSHN